MNWGNNDDLLEKQSTVWAILLLSKPEALYNKMQDAIVVAMIKRGSHMHTFFCIFSIVKNDIWCMTNSKF